MTLEEMAAHDHEQVAYARDPDAGLACIVAIHDTRLGPAVGGTRMLDYDTESDALADALGLSRAMAYKTAAADLDLGGGKGVILCDPDEKTDELLRAYGETVDAFGGSFITGEDVNIDADDVATIGEETRYVGGDPDAGVDVTAYGVVHGMRACLEATRGDASLQGVDVTIQGCGKVGSSLVARLVDRGATVGIADIESERAERLAAGDDDAVEVVDPEAVYDRDCDIFAPCALGGVIDDETVPRLECDIVAGSANNQLEDRRQAAALADRDMLYAPDYVVNAGGLIAGANEAAGDSSERAYEKAERIFDRMRRIVEDTRAEGITTLDAADRYAERRMREGGGS
jgi:leucine dehydrogenase